MPTRQATAVILAAARALGADADPSAWNADLRRGGRRPRTADELAEQIAELGSRVDLTMLPRDGALLDALVAAESLPLVVLAPAAGGAGAVVLERRDGARAVGATLSTGFDAAQTRGLFKVSAGAATRPSIGRYRGSRNAEVSCSACYGASACAISASTCCGSRS